MEMFISNIVREIRWLAFIIKKRLHNSFYSLCEPKGRAQLPNNCDGSVLVHLGCGDINARGYINVDFKAAPHVHYAHDVTSLPFLNDCSVDLIYACHVMEHFPVESIKGVLWEWRRVLKRNGILRISVPDFDKLLGVYYDTHCEIESIRAALMGHMDGYNSHLLIFNYKYLKNILENNGFVGVRFWDPHVVSHHGFSDWSSNPITYNEKEYRISLNVEAIKE
jgi:predicted SAM-dependent methyltransferase